MTELIVTRGIAGSGKSTWAKAWVAEDVRRRARVERDDLRNMLHDGVWKGRHTENQVINSEIAVVGALLLEGISVVVSDTNLDVATFGMWKDFAEKMNVKFSMQDFRDVPLEVCIERNALRTGRACIPEQAIRDQFARI
jgi:predicted kinase